MKKKLAIFTRDFFGYHIDTYYLCKYAADKYEVHYVSFEAPKGNSITLSNVNVEKVPYYGNKFLRYLRLIYVFRTTAKEYNYNIIFIKYFPGCFILRFLLSSIIVLDIRTGSVSENSWQRLIYDLMLRFEGFFFNRITIISDGLQKKLKFHSAHILPLGAEQFNIANKNFNACTMNLIYIGTLSGRDIHKTILGVQSFLIQNPNIPLRYTIVGEGREGERKALEELVAQLGLSDIVELVGYVPNTQVTPYLEEATVGISFVPICERFQYQPPTKTYEYLAAGIPVMATATHENAKIINGSNGILIDDSAESFSENLGYMHRHINMYNSTIIKASVMENTWDKIILENAIPYFESISGEKK